MKKNDRAIKNKILIPNILIEIHEAYMIQEIIKIEKRKRNKKKVKAKMI